MCTCVMVHCMYLHGLKYTMIAVCHSIIFENKLSVLTKPVKFNLLLNVFHLGIKFLKLDLWMLFLT